MTMEAPAVDMEVAWRNFRAARTQEAALTWVSLHARDDLWRRRVWEFVEESLGQLAEHRPPQAGADDLIEQIAAALLGAPGDRDNPEWGLRMEACARNAELPITVREAALRSAFTHGAQRQEMAQREGHDHDNPLARLLTGASYGRQNSVEGLALHAAAYAGRQGLMAADLSVLAPRLQEILSSDDAAEYTTLVALEVASLLPEFQGELLAEVRRLARGAESEAIKVAAIRLLGARGDETDLGWLMTTHTSSGALHHAIRHATLRLGDSGRGL